MQRGRRRSREGVGKEEEGVKGKKGWDGAETARIASAQNLFTSCSLSSFRCHAGLTYCRIFSRVARGQFAHAQPGLACLTRCFQ